MAKADGKGWVGQKIYLQVCNTKENVSEKINQDLPRGVVETPPTNLVKKFGFLRTIIGKKREKVRY